MGRKVQISVSIDLEDLEKLEDLSRKTGESISAIARRAIKDLLGNREEEAK